MEQTFERVVLEERPDRLALRVRSVKWTSMLRAVFVRATGIGLIVAMGLPPGTVDVGLIVVVACSWLFILLASANSAALRNGVRRSEYKRLARLFEVRRPAGAASVGSYRDQPNVIVTVDGASYSGKDFRGVVVAHSNEWTIPSTRGDKSRLLPRAAPTLVFQNALYELDVYEGADVARADDLADTIAMALAGAKVKAPRITWDNAEFEVQLYLFFSGVIASLATVAAGLSSSKHATTAQILITLALVADFLGVAVAAKHHAYRRSYAARDLADKARDALTHSPHA